MSVVLPAPFGPSTAQRSPSVTCQSMPVSTGVEPVEVDLNVAERGR